MDRKLSSAISKDKAASRLEVKLLLLGLLAFELAPLLRLLSCIFVCPFKFLIHPDAQERVSAARAQL